MSNFKSTCKIIAQHLGTGNRFIYGTIIGVIKPDFYGEEYNPKAVRFPVDKGTAKTNGTLRRLAQEKPDFRVFAEW